MYIVRRIRLVPVGILTKMEASNDFLDNLAAKQHEKLLREIWEDDLTPRKKRIHDGELHERAVIQNLEDEDPYAQDGELWNPNKHAK